MRWGRFAVLGLAIASVCLCAPVAALGAPPLKWSNPVALDTSGLQSISCPSTSLCVAGDRSGQVQVTNPTLTPVSWVENPVSGAGVLSAMDCPSINLCVAGDQKGLLYTATDLHVLESVVDICRSREGRCSPASSGIRGRSCRRASRRSRARRSRCASPRCSLTSTSRSRTAFRAAPTRPAAPPRGASTTASARGSRLKRPLALRCTLCVLADQSGSIVWNTSPTGEHWNVVQVDKLNAITGISCPSKSLCVGVDFFGNVIWSTRPTHSGWKRALRVDGFNAFTGISCPTTSFCVAVDVHGSIFTSTRPTGGKSAWHKDRNFGRALHVSCPTRALCVAVDRGGRFVIGRKP